jgi:uncharacterized tellurite resistance protein B-like protein
MSLWSRFLGIGREQPNDEPASLQPIVRELERLPQERARFVAASAYILARVALSDLEIEDREVLEMQRILREEAGLDEREARLAVEIAIGQATGIGGTDDYLVARAFRQMTERGERVALLRCLVAVAAADDRISSVESRELVTIGEQLGFTREEVNTLRLERREQIAELRPIAPARSRGEG